MRHQQVEVFPTPEVTLDICHEALFRCDSVTWTLLLAHDYAFINKGIDCMGRTIFSLS